MPTEGAIPLLYDLGFQESGMFDFHYGTDPFFPNLAVEEVSHVFKAAFDPSRILLMLTRWRSPSIKRCQPIHELGSNR